VSDADGADCTENRFKKSAVSRLESVSLAVTPSLEESNRGFVESVFCESAEAVLIESDPETLKTAVWAWWAFLGEPAFSSDFTGEGRAPAIAVRTISNVKVLFKTRLSLLNKTFINEIYIT
jgi:hypothetical protein